MEFRKVQETGGTFFVSLPRDWAQKNGITKGSLVSIAETKNGRVVVDAKYELEKNIEVARVAPSPYLKREIMGKYLLGFDVIRVESGTRLPPKTSEEVRETLRGLTGLEIVEEDANRIVLQFLLDPELFTPDRILRREYLFASSMHKDVMTALLERDVNLANAVLKRDDEVDRLYFLIVRLLRTVLANPRLSEKMELSMIDCLDYRMIASFVEAIGDDACKIARDIIGFSQVQISDDVLQYIKQISDTAYSMHERAMQAVFSRTFELIDAVMKGRDEIQTCLSAVEKLMETEQPKALSFISSINFSLSRIRDESIDIADTILPR